jgi:hypothetical protein
MAKALSEPSVGTPAKSILFCAASAQLSERQAEFRTGRPLIPIPAGSTDFFPQGFDPASVDFAFQAFCVGISGGTRGFTLLGCGKDVLHQVPQSYQGLRPVFPLGAVLLRLDDDDAFPGNAMVPQFQEAFFDEIGKGRGVDVEAQVCRGGNLVDILSPRALSPDGVDLDFMEWNGNVV